nr:MAG TPA: Restriction endonuclease [Caudoviricetes sp.]
MSKKTVKAILILFTIITFGKILNPTVIMMFLIIAIATVAIHLSGEDFKNIFKKPYSRMTMNDLMKVNPYQFERVVADYYKSQGYTVLQTRKSGDGGKDLVMYKGTKTYFVECKQFAQSNAVGRPLVQKLVGACHPHNAEAIFVTTSKFTEDARQEARLSKVQLVDGSQLLQKINSRN